MNAGRARVMVWYRVPRSEAGTVEEGYDRVSRQLAGTPGLIGNELLRAADDASSLLVMSEWETLAAFREWEEGQSHRNTTSPLRQYQDRARGRFYEVYEVAAAF
jgi:heme-degrading monooxygenase HmoA